MRSQYSKRSLVSLCHIGRHFNTGLTQSRLGSSSEKWTTSLTFQKLAQCTLHSFHAVLALSNGPAKCITTKDVVYYKTKFKVFTNFLLTYFRNQGVKTFLNLRALGTKYHCNALVV